MSDQDDRGGGFAHGMTLREFYAGLAMLGELVGSFDSDRFRLLTAMAEARGITMSAAIAAEAIASADALIAELAKDE